MASKSKKRSTQRSTLDPISLVRRNFERGNFKQALKDARVAYRREPTHELRSLLEHVYIARAEQLARQGQREAARRIINDLMELGVTESTVEAGLQELFLLAGMLDQLALESSELPADDQDRLQVRIADMAIQRPQEVPPSMPEIRVGAGTIRAALEAVERGDDFAAVSKLKGIPRQSPFADWKLFVRGLMAYYRNDKSEMLANWDRLDHERAAARIAAPLRFMAGVRLSSDNGRLAQQASQLEKQAIDQTILSGLLKMQTLVARRDWSQIVRSFRTLGGRLKKLDNEIYRRTVDWLAGELVHEEQSHDLERLLQCADPPALDPRWNRIRALLWDEVGNWKSHRYWREYLSDLEKIACLPPDEQQFAQAMVHLRLADDYVEDARGLRGCPCSTDHSDEIEESEAEAMNHFDQCVSRAPTFRQGHLLLADFHADAGRIEESIAVRERWLEQAPDDIEILLDLARYFIQNNQPSRARDFAERAYRLKPLDREIGDLLWNAHLSTARQLALDGQFEPARSELAAADCLRPDRRHRFDVLAQKAMFETKADDLSAARNHLEQAQAGLTEPTALWLALSIEAIRMDLPDTETWLYEKRWNDALRRRCDSETAGLMCGLLNDQSQMRQPHARWDDHVKALRKYVRRCTRVKWQSEHLREVGEFLSMAKDYSTLAKVVKRGLKQFPDLAQLHWLAAWLEIVKGPRKCNRTKASDQLEAAIRCGTASTDLRDKKIVERAEKNLAMLMDTPSPGALDGTDSHRFGHDPEKIAEVLDDMEEMPREMLLRLIAAVSEKMGVNIDPDDVLAELEARRSSGTSGGR